MLMCKDVHQVVASGEVEDFGWMKRMELKLHLMMCNHCRRYVDQMAALGRGIRSLLQGRQASPEQLEQIEDRIVVQCCGHHPDS